MKLRILSFTLLALIASDLIAMDQKEKAEVTALKPKTLKRSRSAPSGLCQEAAIIVWVHFSTKEHLLQSNWIEITTPEGLPFNKFKEKIAEHWNNVDISRLLLVSNLSNRYPETSDQSLKQLSIFSGTKILAFK